MNKKLIEALTLLLKYQNTDRAVNEPVRCLYEELIVRIDDINNVSYEDMMKLKELHFYSILPYTTMQNYMNGNSC